MKQPNVKILFFSYTYPPAVVGGVQTYMKDLTTHFKSINPETYTLINTRGLWFLPFFIPYSIIKAVYLIKKHKITNLHACDGNHALEALIIRKLTGVKISVTIHGLDIIGEYYPLQVIIHRLVKRMDKIICVSNATRSECLMRGIDENKCVAIFNGVDPDTFPLKRPKHEMRTEIEKITGLNLKGKKILFTNGRLMKRKGVEWFTSHVIPHLDKNYIYLVSGDGPERERIEKTIKEYNLNDRVHLLGKTDFKLLQLLYNATDIFIMPNIRVHGTMEGFGLVILEAGSCGVPVVASDIEGISDAVIQGVTGYLVPERDVNAYIKRIKSAGLPAKKIIEATKNNFDWEIITRLYLKEISLI